MSLGTAEVKGMNGNFLGFDNSDLFFCISERKSFFDPKILSISFSQSQNILYFIIASISD